MHTLEYSCCISMHICHYLCMRPRHHIHAYASTYRPCYPLTKTYRYASVLTLLYCVLECAFTVKTFSCSLKALYGVLRLCTPVVALCPTVALLGALYPYTALPIHTYVYLPIGLCTVPMCVLVPAPCMEHGHTPHLQGIGLSISLFERKLIVLSRIVSKSLFYFSLSRLLSSSVLHRYIYK